MIALTGKITALIAFVALAATPSLAQDKRIALVIGNAAYKHTPPLKNPRNDAIDMTAKLKDIGFTVIEGRDLDKAAMDRTVRDFAEKLAGADVGLFFYAGHGLQVGGRNYLVPTDAKLKTASAIDFEMVRLDLVHRTMERESATNILIMDACRDNPLARNLARALGTRSSQIGRGLATVESGEGTLISFSTQPGNVALDGTGRNSPFAEALLKHIGAPGDDLPTVLINVRNDVMKATARRQVPWEHSAMTARFFFIPPAPTLKSTPENLELAFWMSVKDSTAPQVLGSYLERFPEGEFAPVARALIEHYEKQIKLEQAARERERKQQEETRKAAKAKQLQDEKRVREAALAEEAKSDQAAARLEKERAELEARSEDLRKALEEVRLAREAAKVAEEERRAAATAAETATKAAEEAVAKKRALDSGGDAMKLAALPRIEASRSANQLDGSWLVHRLGPSCRSKNTRFSIVIDNGVVKGYQGGGKISGTVESSGEIRFKHAGSRGGGTLHYIGRIDPSAGSGTFSYLGKRCRGTIKLTRN